MTTPDVPPPALIRLVTGRYHEMQGLTTMADSVFPLSWGLMLAYLHAPWVHSLWHFVPFAIGAALWIWYRYARLNRRIEGFYTARCGRVSTVLTVDYLLFFVQGVMLVPMLFQFRAANWALATVALLLLAVHPLWIVRRDWPYRAHWLLPAGVGVFMSLVLIAVGVYNKDETVAWQMALLLTGGAATAAAGLLDHLLLLRTLRPAGDPEGAGSAAEAGSCT